MEFAYKAIVAYDSKRGIGKNNSIPWYLPEDLKRLKELTVNQNAIMGSKTFQSIIDKIGKPLPRNTNIVLSKNLTSLDYPRTILCHSVEEVKDNYKEGWIFGGSYIYDLFLPYTQEIYATEIDGDFQCDTFFPQINKDQWIIKSTEQREGFKFVLYARK